MCMGRGIAKPVWHRLPTNQINKIKATNRHHLRNTAQSGIGQTVSTRRNRGAEQMVCHLLRCKIQHGGKSPLGCQTFHRPPAHSGAVKDSHLEPPRLQRWFQRYHVRHDFGIEPRHRNDRTVAFGCFNSARGPKRGPCRLRQRGFADGIQPVKPARPKDHLNICGHPARRDQRGKADGRHHIFWHAKRKGRADIKRKIGAH